MRWNRAIPSNWAFAPAEPVAGATRTSGRVRLAMFRPLLATGVLAGALALAGGETAAYAHKDHETFPLTCDNGQSYVVEVKGGRDFTPAHDEDSNSVLVPVAFGPVTVFDSTGAVVESYPASTKGQSVHGNKSLTNCTYTYTFTDPETGETYTGTGSVTLLITPNKK